MFHCFSEKPMVFEEIGDSMAGALSAAAVKSQELEEKGYWINITTIQVMVDDKFKYSVMLYAH